jgi:Flp pilus assembly pilin Flp
MSTQTTKRHESARERGAGLAEYALLLSLIAIVCVVAVTTLGTTIATALGVAAGIF